MSCPSDRLEITCNHIVAENEKVSNNNNNNNIEVNHVYGDENGIDIETLRNIIDGKEWKFKDKCREFLANNPSFVIQDDPTRSSVYQRERLFSLLRQIGISGLAKSEDAVYRPNRFFALLEVISYFDLGLFLKTFIQYLVWGGSVVRIGTERHSHLLKDINSVDLCGAYGMTEQGHGSNVRACQTTAIYDKENKEFIINSPNDGSRKMWIANTACHGLKACIFARLILDGRDCGVNAFIVPIRNKSLIIEKNVEIEDCGNKLGMNGLDNGILRFTNKRIPRENLLNKVTDVTEDGSLISIFDRETDRFRAITESLVGERLSPFLGPTKVGLIISLRYANWRVQFSPGKGQQEVPLLFYTSHKRRLLQILGTLFGYDFMYHYLWDRVESSPTQADIEEIYALSAGVKSYSGWFTNLALQTFTECCGAQGFRACNRFGHFKADAGAMLTGAGDNTVLVQQVAKFMFNNYYRQSKNIKNKKQDKFTGVLEHLNKNPSPEADFNTLEGQHELLEYRERLLFDKVNENLIKRAKQGMNRFEAWNAELHLVMGLSSSYIDREVHKIFMKKIEEAPDNLKELLTDLCSICVLSSDEIPAFAFNKGYKPPLFNSFEAQERLNELCIKIAPYAEEITESFGVPEKCLPRRDLLDGIPQNDEL